MAVPAQRRKSSKTERASLAEQARQAKVDVGATPGLAAGDTAPPAVSALRDATRRMDIPAIERLLDEAFAGQRFEAATSNVVFPALRAIGEDWADGTIDVGMEHAASETIRFGWSHCICG